MSFYLSLWWAGNTFVRSHNWTICVTNLWQRDNFWKILRTNEPLPRRSPRLEERSERLGTEGPTRGHCFPSDGNRLQHPCCAGQALRAHWALLLLFLHSLRFLCTEKTGGQAECINKLRGERLCCSATLKITLPFKMKYKALFLFSTCWFGEWYF